MQWHDKTEVKKGAIGEAIVDAFLRSHNVIPYIPAADGAHPFDRLCATKDKQKIFIADVKAKARRTYFPDTGINERHFNEYMRFVEGHAVDVWLFFVDEHLRKVYGGSLKDLARERKIIDRGRILVYPIRDRGIIYFPVCAMRNVDDLDDADVEELRRLSKRSYEYEG